MSSPVHTRDCGCELWGEGGESWRSDMDAERMRVDVLYLPRALRYAIEHDWLHFERREKNRHWYQLTANGQPGRHDSLR
jgi:hypothetical protein